MNGTRTTVVGNRLLAAMSREEFERLRPRLVATTFRRRQLLVARGAPIKDVVFPDSGVISFMAALEDGATLEVGMLGIDGAVGIQSMFNVQSSPWSAEVQIQGSGRTLSADVFATEMARQASLWDAIMRYARESVVQSVQLATCNRHHSIQQRCARWLLMAQDRVGADQFPVTHDVLGLVLGIHRPSASLAGENLRAAGLIEYRHGKLRIVDRGRLQAAACECYPLLKV